MRNQKGFALEATIFLLTLMSVLMVAAYTSIAAVTRSAALDYRGSRVSYAAEAAADNLLAQLADALEDGDITDAEIAALEPPTMEGFTFVDVAVTKMGAVIIESVTDGPFSGLYRGRSGDLPPRPECAELWHQKLLAKMPDLRLTLLVGQYAQAYYLGGQRKKTLTATVQVFREYLPELLPLPHPSPRNILWLKRNPWFEAEVVPQLQQLVAPLL